MLKYLLALLVVLCFIDSFAQEHQIVAFKFGKGVRFTSKDSTFYMKFSARIQIRYDGVQQLTSGEKYKDFFLLRRSRLKFDGYAFTKKLVYKLELDVVSGSVKDAVIKWNFYKGFTIWAGQTKLPGNRERVISSQKLQFVDRSILNSGFTLDRDIGVQIRNEHTLGGIVLREIVSVSTGNGVNYIKLREGRNYTARVEILPFGKFIKNGDYVGGDIYREPTPKLAIGATFDYNNKSIRSRGQRGEVFDNSRELKTYFADLMFKVKGFSIMSEFAHRTTLGSPVIDSLQSFYTGWGINFQSGYVFKNNWEIAGRVAVVETEEASLFPNQRQYALAVSRYILGHNLKVQTDISYFKQDFSDALLTWRLQVELAF